ncbi:hypothetical protein [Longimicrobium sp.]|uniref:hypothetical protein n=1 Tax=Longimicrobium sp. TaxID=2029185 RepID=UPI002E33AF88|nr:hypothetical protein [Longimicrobium sp.]HEX6041456.1 hypothetical protein [Longimicrobium sp.]
MKGRIPLLLTMILAAVPAAAQAPADTVAVQVAALRMIWTSEDLTEGATVRCLGEWTPETGFAPVDPKPALMAALAGNDPPVVPRSACDLPVEFWVDQPHVMEKTSARVTVSARCGRACSWSAECYVARVAANDWRPARCEMRGSTIKYPDAADSPSD